MPIKPHSKKITWTFICLFLLFVVPLTLALWMFITGNSLSLRTVNHGQLIQPSLDISRLNLSHDQKIERGHWLLLYVNPALCDKNCETVLYNMRQIRTATGKDADRIQRAILTFSDSTVDAPLQQLLNTEFKGTLHLITSKQSFIHFSQLNILTKAVLQTGGIYLVDPLGNVMMFYALTVEPMNIFKDLTRLLKLSQIG